MKSYYQDDSCTIYNGDCLEVMKELEQVDCILTDPPYGIGADKGVGGFGSSGHTAKKYKDKWDIRPSKILFNELLDFNVDTLIFGGNYFTDLLPMNGHWIVWDKTGQAKFKNPFSDCELIWTNINKKIVKKYTYVQQGFVCKEKYRYHPTQKPTDLIRMILEDYTKEGDTILDPFLGSGTTARACKDLGRKCIGIEISKEYCDIAVKRLGQGVLF